MEDPTSVVVAESSQVGSARRLITRLASALEFSEVRQGELAIVVTELGNNLLRHATHGELFWRPTESKGAHGIELVAADKGPGMGSVGQCLKDGYSTAGTAGNGLGAIARLTQGLEIYSVPGGGTVMRAEVWAAGAAPSSADRMTVGVVSRPKPGQEMCGDAWAVEHLPHRSLYLIADGLGHGPDAAIASRNAVRAFRKNRALRPREIIDALDKALQGTRGAAVALAEVDLHKEVVCYAGIGNISGSIVAPEHTHNMVSHNGIVGHQVRKIQEFTYPWPQDSMVVMHSDGLSSKWQIERYPGLFMRGPALVAGVLYRDFSRDIDDATVLVGRAPHRDSNQ